MESRSRMKGCSLMGYQAPLPSKGTRSARGRNSTFKKRNLEGVFMDPFELLATVAENEFHNEKTAAFKKQNSRRWTYSNQIIKTDLKEDENYAAQELEHTQVAKSGTHSSSGAKEEEPDDQGSSDENAAVNCALARMLSHDREKKNSDLGILGSKDINEHVIGLKSIGGVDNGDKSSYIDLGLGIGTPGRFGEAESGEGKGENEIDVSSLGRWSKMGRCHQREDDVMMLDAHSPPATSAISEEAPISAAAKAPPPLVSSDSSGGSPICPSSCRHGSMSNFKDEDVNSSECNTAITAAKRSLAISYTRKRRDGSGKHRKRMFSDMDSELNSGLGDMASYSGMLTCLYDTTERRSVRPANNGCYELYTYQRSAKRTPSKKRRLDDDVKIPFPLEMQPNTTSATPLGAKLEADETDTCAEKMCTETFVGVSSSPDSTIVDSDEPQKMPNEAHVKVAINSFTVPELTIDIPETASIAKLKRAVMEAAMKLLGGGLRVCMLYQGEKITDENFTLDQVGKPQDGKLESVGFMLEPSTTPTSQTSSEDPLFMLSEAAAFEPVVVPRYEMAPCETTKVPAKCRASKANNVSSEMSAASGEKAQNQVTPWVKSESEAIQAGTNLGALTLHSSVAAANAVPMAMVPVNPKTREMGKRRIRRPFTVTEVEALVHAVEKLGTGRWRDVKLRAFENAKHRTYVDLKDKWKTLVHTAQISPHQRRGEPVPQDLLDRVISAHTFWTEQQARQQAELSM